MAWDVGVIPSAASTAFAAPATAAYAERSLRPAPTYGLRILVDIALKALCCDKRPDDAVGCLDDRRCAAFGQPAPAAGLRSQRRVAPALARRRGPRRTGDPDWTTTA